MKTCTVEDCPHPHRARGLCATHWKRDRGKRESWSYECAGCGRGIVKSYWIPPTRRPTCSDLCRAWLQHGPVSCLVPFSHASRYVPPLPRPAPYIRQSRDCTWCGVEFPAAQDQSYCTRLCKGKHARARRRGREVGSLVSFTWTEVMRVFLAFDKRCAYCEQFIDGQPDPDHVVPLSRHGGNGITNILPACSPCNSDKRDLLLAEWNQDRARRSLLPRTVAWAADDPRVSHLARAVRYAA